MYISISYGPSMRVRVKNYILSEAVYILTCMLRALA